jgi:hypothetical protein
MEWEMLLGLTGLYIMTLGLFVHHFRATRVLIRLNEAILEISSANEKVLAVVKGLAAEGAVFLEVDPKDPLGMEEEPRKEPEAVSTLVFDKKELWPISMQRLDMKSKKVFVE